MMLNGVDISLLGPALVAGLLVIATHVPLGIEVLKRGIIFIDLAIAQCAALGVIAASLFFPENGQLYSQIAALAAAGFGAFILTWTEKRFPDIQEAIIGCSFILAASGALLLISHHPHGAEDMKDLLAGQILWVSFADLIPVFLIYAVMLLIWFKVEGARGKAGFYFIFAIIVTASVQLVGVYLVFANLIIPALASRNAGKPLLCAYGVGIVGLFAGLMVSLLLDVPTGPMTVWTLAVTAIVTGFFIRKRGNDEMV